MFYHPAPDNEDDDWLEMAWLSMGAAYERDEAEQRHENDKLWLLALCLTCIGLLLFVVMYAMDRRLPW